jgi:hypothetical protein
VGAWGRFFDGPVDVVKTCPIESRGQAVAQ